MSAWYIIAAMKKDRFTCHVAVGVIILQDNKVLLQKRANTGYSDGLYALPGGCIDGKEPLTQACVREAKEELGIDVQLSDLQLVATCHAAGHTGHRPHELLLFCFQVTKYTGTLQNAEPHKCEEIRFFPLDQLPENSIKSMPKVLACLKNGSPAYFELDWQESC